MLSLLGETTVLKLLPRLYVYCPIVNLGLMEKLVEQFFQIFTKPVFKVRIDAQSLF